MTRVIVTHLAPSLLVKKKTRGIDEDEGEEEETETEKKRKRRRREAKVEFGPQVFRPFQIPIYLL